MSDYSKCGVTSFITSPFSCFNTIKRIKIMVYEELLFRREFALFCFHLRFHAHRNMIANTRWIYKRYGTDTNMIGDKCQNIVPEYP